MFKKRDNFITKATEWPFKKFNLTVIIAIVIILFFRNLFIAPINSYVVNPFLSKIESGTVSNWVTVIFIVLVLIYFYGKIKRNYYYTGKRVTIYTVIITWYSINRIDSDRWIFARFSDSNTWNNIAYLDMLYVLAPPILFYFCEQSGFKETKLHKTIYIKLFKLEKTLFDCLYNCTKRIKKLPLKISEIYTCLKKAPKIKKSDLILDNPIENGKIDCLYRDKIAKDISDILKNIESKTSFAVGITSKWGDGKTSFLKMLTSELEKKDKEAIHIEFSPWYCKTEKDIIALFFDTVSTSLKHYHSSLNNQLKKYSKLLLSIEESSLSKTIDKGLSIFEEHSDVRSIYDSINESIQNLKRTIYITIDDVDRLLAKEIIECFKIIRNTANFGNVIYIVAYDADYVDKALESGLNNTYKGYIDKIIQLPFQLPVIEKSLILKYLEDRLKEKEIVAEEIFEILNPRYYPNFINYEKRYTITNFHTLDITKYFTNIRECNKVLNIFFAYKNILKDEVDLPDLFLVSILKTQYPNEARELYDNKDKYITKRGDFVLEKPTEKEGFKSVINDKIKNINCLNLIETLFLYKSNSIRRISSGDNYYTYYNGVLPSNFLPYTDFEKTLNSKNEMYNFIANLKSPDRIKYRDNFYQKLIHSRPQENKKTVIIILGIIQYKYNNSEKHILEKDLANDLIPLLNDYRSIVIELLSSLIDYMEEVDVSIISTIIHVFREKNLTDIGKAGVTKKIEDRLILDLLVTVFEKAIERNKNYEELIPLYQKCSEPRAGNKEAIITDRAKEIMRKYAFDNSEIYLEHLKNINSNSLLHSSSGFIREILIPEIPEVSPFFIDGKILPEFIELVEKGLKDSLNNKVLIEMRDYANKHLKTEPAKIED